MTPIYLLLCETGSGKPVTASRFDYWPRPLVTYTIP